MQEEVKGEERKRLASPPPNPPVLALAKESVPECRRGCFLYFPHPVAVGFLSLLPVSEFITKCQNDRGQRILWRASGTFLLVVAKSPMGLCQMNRIAEALDTHRRVPVLCVCMWDSGQRTGPICEGPNKTRATRGQNNLETAIPCEVRNFLQFVRVTTWLLIYGDFSFILQRSDGSEVSVGVLVCLPVIICVFPCLAHVPGFSEDSARDERDRLCLSTAWGSAAHQGWTRCSQTAGCLLAQGHLHKLQRYFISALSPSHPAAGLMTGLRWL